MKITYFKNLVTVFLVFAFVFISTWASADEPVIRVSLFPQGTSSFKLEVSGPVQLKDGNTGKILKEISRLSPTKVSGGKKGIVLGGAIYHTNQMDVLPSPKALLKVDSGVYKGELRIYVIGPEKILVVNHIRVENYIKGVLAGEMPKRWPDNALGAQAIAARTYALYQKAMNQEELFDVSADVSSQVYGGQNSESWESNRIVDETRGIVLVYNNTLIPAFFHSCCGGKTEEGKMVWNKISLPCLKSVACDTCADSPQFYWTYNIRLEELRKKLASLFPDLDGPIRNVRILEKTSSGRVDSLAIESDQGEFIVNAVTLRLTVSARMIKSTRFEIDRWKDQLIFRGQGWGHGVGLCQWGAKGLAERNFQVEEILSFYYPGSKLVKIE